MIYNIQSIAREAGISLDELLQWKKENEKLFAAIALVSYSQGYEDGVNDTEEGDW